ncbi:hypothetical protein FNU76_19085 [Chitinimonas arctica]|uniref:Uncharacterized protein n=1 Tax=Chitinimonas arctica TaxID=2594795 RepID=A0A516SJF3_9NEIS|nr:methylamine utilization protein MauJ [Chitinimonas arctica]QDQ28285.1 hypothetical protein FNU76_19085 [Chitinimonas arctica]
MSKKTIQIDSISAEDLGPPGVKGELCILGPLGGEQKTEEERLNDQAMRAFTVEGLLSKSARMFENIRSNFGPEDGESYFCTSDLAVGTKIAVPAGEVKFKTNSRGEKSSVHFKCDATHATEARCKFLTAALPFLDYLSYIGNCPVDFGALKILDVKNNCTTIMYVSPYRKTLVRPHARLVHIEMEPIYAMYREAKNSNSDFYKFLCYYKILEGIFKVLGPAANKQAKELKINLNQINCAVPEAENMPDDCLPYIGKSVRRFFDEILREYFRNDVAHFVKDDGAILNLSNPDHIDKFSLILHTCELCARLEMENHENILSQLLKSKSM